MYTIYNSHITDKTQIDKQRKASLKVVIIRLILLAGLIQFNTRRKLFVTTLAIVDKNILLIATLLIKYHLVKNA